MFILYGIWGGGFGTVGHARTNSEDCIYAVCSGHMKTTRWPNLNSDVDHSLFDQLVQRAQLLLFTAIRPQFSPINPL